MPTIWSRERDTYEAAWQVPGYTAHSPGLTYLDTFLEMAQPREGARVLDAGCGQGVAGVALAARGYQVQLCDLTDAALTDDARRLSYAVTPLWAPLRRVLQPVEWVYCCDVLEHVPPTFTMLVVSRLLELATRGVFLSIALERDHYGVWVGTPLHRTVQSYSEWRDQLSEIGAVLESRDLLHTGLYVVAPR